MYLHQLQEDFRAENCAETLPNSIRETVVSIRAACMLHRLADSVVLFGLSSKIPGCCVTRKFPGRDEGRPVGKV
jgi:hypothetical protein